MEETPQPNQPTTPVKRSPMGWLLIIVIIIVVFGIFYTLSAKKAVSPKMQNENQITITKQATGQPTMSAASPSSIAVEQVSVIGNEFSFTPSTITVKANQPVQLTFKNEGKYPHNFTISEFNLQTKTIHPGEDDMVTFTPTKTGTFTYICTVPGHADRGMKGTLTVQ